jgi:ABC-type branched-subunit amino acid transport system ATPase component
MTAGYGGVPVISDVSLQAEAGSIVTLVGANGAGKSTLLKALFGLLPQTTGRVEVDGANISGWAPHRVARRGLAYVPQSENVFPSMSVVENLEMGAFIRKDDPRQRIGEVLSLFPDLREFSIRRKAGDLSGGQRNILAMARALMLDPKVMLLDEPTAGLAPNNVGRVWEQIHRISATGTAVVVVEQNVEVALGNADWVYVLGAGRSLLNGPAAEVARRDLRSVFLGKDGTAEADHAAVRGRDRMRGRN